ncbi:hypothetical protein EUX98_g6366 [Antrodiella citrinella]|uniref:ATP-dependent DNA helicase CHL1 n=1 Tax=Antrodiella citrinella TaxID=2447956 RepID=A0A4S4MRB5_9APHY|nr:hypothetical protein EUX98_g6366 [Antrodiella citrinella]
MTERLYSEIDWVTAQTAERKRRELEADELEYVERLDKARRKEELLRKAANGRVNKRQKVSHTSTAPEDELDDSQFLPESDQLQDDEEDNLSPAVRALMKKLYRPDETKNKEQELACTKIYYASRTHSQLSQVLHELRKLKINLSVSIASMDGKVAATVETKAAKRPLSELDDNSHSTEVGTRAVSLGSRKQLCINESIKTKAGDLDEACRQRLSEKGDRRCQYLPPMEDEIRMLDFRDQVLSRPKDIEDLVEAGHNAQTCPYFGARRAIPQAQLVMLPYNLLLQKAARESLGIDLKDQVVIVDEAHNPVKLSKLARLSSVTPPLHTVENFILALTAASEDGRVTFSMNEGHVEIKYQHLNPSTHFQEVVNTARSVVLAGGTMSPISDVIHQLFSTLTGDRLTTFSCGHIIPSSNLQTLILKKGPRGGELQFKYDRRNDQTQIAELGQIIFNFSNIVPGGMVVFVPSYSFLNLVTTAWEGSGLMDKLRAKKKVFMEPQESSAVENTLREYAAEIQDLLCNVPSLLVVQTRKTDSETTSKARKPGAIMFAVIGAKLSEGLNFTDDLARAVLVVGLPFANLASPELRERMSYVNRQEQSRSLKRAPGVKDAATELYENMCMNAVNQSIGRAIRHRGDWASLILIDGRYSTPRIRQKLPKWIGEHTTVTETFGDAMKQLGMFYREKRIAA